MTESYAHLYRCQRTDCASSPSMALGARPAWRCGCSPSAILAGRPIRVFNDGRMQRDFTYIDDIVAGVVAALDRPPADDGVAKPGGSIAPTRSTIWATTGRSRSAG